MNDGERVELLRQEIERQTGGTVTETYPIRNGFIYFKVKVKMKKVRLCFLEKNVSGPSAGGFHAAFFCKAGSNLGKFASVAIGDPHRPRPFSLIVLQKEAASPQPWQEKLDAYFSRSTMLFLLAVPTLLVLHVLGIGVLAADQTWTEAQA